MNNYHVFQQVSKPPKVGLKKELHIHHSKGQWTRHWSEDKFPLTNGGSVNNENPECKLSPVRSIGDNDFLRVISWACWYYHPLLVLVNYLLCYVAIYIC